MAATHRIKRRNRQRIISPLWLAILALSIVTCCSQSNVLALTDVSPAAFAAHYFETPITKMRALEGQAYETGYGPMGYITFESDNVPVLRNQANFKQGGMFVRLVDTFLVLFDEKAWPFFTKGYGMLAHD